MSECPPFLFEALLFRMWGLLATGLLGCPLPEVGEHEERK